MENSAIFYLIVELSFGRGVMKNFHACKISVHNFIKTYGVLIMHLIIIQNKRMQWVKLESV